eukprot:gene13849-biopygen18587
MWYGNEGRRGPYDRMNSKKRPRAGYGPGSGSAASPTTTSTASVGGTGHARATPAPPQAKKCPWPAPRPRHARATVSCYPCERMHRTPSPVPFGMTICTSERRAFGVPRLERVETGPNTPGGRVPCTYPSDRCARFAAVANEAHFYIPPHGGNATFQATAGLDMGIFWLGVARAWRGHVLFPQQRQCWWWWEKRRCLSPVRIRPAVVSLNSFYRTARACLRFRTTSNALALMWCCSSPE